MLTRAQLYGALFLISVLIFWVSRDFGMFWDNVLFASRMGGHLHENGLFSWMMPDSFDPGHPPFLGFVLAIGWNIFGQSVQVSHLMMFPFVFGLLVQLFRLCEHYLEHPEYIFLAFLLVIFDPTLGAQLILVNPEVIQLFFFFMALNSYLRKQRMWQVIALAFLGIVSYRGMMLCAGLFLFEAVDRFFIQQENKMAAVKKLIPAYVIASLPALIYLGIRLYYKGWIYTHPDSPWYEYSATVDFKGLLRNIIILGHRYVDFGRIFILLTLGGLVLKFKGFNDQKNKQLFWAAVLSCSVVVMASLRATNPMGHRYYLASYLLLALLTARMLFQTQWKYKNQLLGALMIALVTGNLWIYPKHIAQGWDASLAVMPYFDLRKQAINYMDENEVPIEQTGTFSPNANEIHVVDLNGDQRKFPPFDGSQPYALYSNVYNLSDEELSALDQYYNVRQSYEKHGVVVQLLKRK